jgi:hypothetical protein
LPDFGGFIIPVGAKTISSPDSLDPIKKSGKKSGAKNFC